jgi:hypothetical protein
MAEMQTRRVKSPNAVLASTDTALVIVRGFLPAGIQAGDRFDIEVRSPSQSDTTSLRGGRLLETRLQELAVLDDHRVHEGRLLGLAEGPVMVDPSAKKDDRVLQNRGRVLGGGVCVHSRALGLVLTPDNQSVLNSARIETAVNRRFHMFHKGVKTGVAKAKTDQYVELLVHPRYKDNIDRYIRVVSSVALRETETEQMERLSLLEKQLLDPITASPAALELEAIGQRGVETLRKGVAAQDTEVRFYSAEALAYLDQAEAVPTLAEVARVEPAFRVFALAALSAMDNFSAYEALRDMLNLPSAETRYGAFRALWAMNPNDALVLGEDLGKEFSYHVLNTEGPPMIHVTRSKRPEIVVFGAGQRFNLPLAIEAGNRIMVNSTRPGEPGEIAVSRFAVGEPEQKRWVSSRVDDVVRAIVELGGTYPDVVQALQEARQCGALLGRLEIDALPQAGRMYTRLAGKDRSGDDDGAEPRRRAVSPRPDLFGSPDAESGQLGAASDRPPDMDASDSADRPRPVRSFFAKMVGRGQD